MLGQNIHAFWLFLYILQFCSIMSTSIYTSVTNANLGPFWGSSNLIFSNRMYEKWNPTVSMGISLVMTIDDQFFSVFVVCVFFMVTSLHISFSNCDKANNIMKGLKIVLTSVSHLAGVSVTEGCGSLPGQGAYLGCGFFPKFGCLWSPIWAWMGDSQSKSFSLSFHLSSFLFSLKALHTHTHTHAYIYIHTIHTYIF